MFVHVVCLESLEDLEMADKDEGISRCFFRALVLLAAHSEVVHFSRHHTGST